MSAADWTTIDQPQDIRLVVADMDGTLLDEHGRIPEGFWDMLARLRARGVEFVPASGRQYATLRNMFASKASEVLDGESFPISLRTAMSWRWTARSSKYMASIWASRVAPSTW